MSLLSRRSSQPPKLSIAIPEDKKPTPPTSNPVPLPRSKTYEAWRKRQATKSVQLLPPEVQLGKSQPDSEPTSGTSTASSSVRSDSSSLSFDLNLDGQADSKPIKIPRPRIEKPIHNPFAKNRSRSSTDIRRGPNDDDRPPTPTSAGTSVRSSAINISEESLLVSDNEDEEGFVALNIPPDCKLPPFINTDCGCRLSYPARSCRDHVAGWEAFLEATLPPKPPKDQGVRLRKVRDRHRMMRNERLKELRAETERMEALAKAVKQTEDPEFDIMSLATTYKGGLREYVEGEKEPHLHNLLQMAGKSEAKKRKEEIERERAERYEREEDMYMQLILRRKEELNKEETEELRYLRRRLKSRA